MIGVPCRCFRAGVRVAPWPLTCPDRVAACLLPASSYKPQHDPTLYYLGIERHSPYSLRFDVFGRLCLACNTIRRRYVPGRRETSVAPISAPTPRRNNDRFGILYANSQPET